MIRKLLKKNTIWIGASETWLKVMSFIAILMIARIYGDTIFGQVSYVMAYLQLFQIIFDFGLHMIMTREISQNIKKTEDILAKYFGFKVLVGLIIVAALLASIPFLQKDTAVITYLLAASGFMLFMSINQLLRGVFVAHEKFSLDAFSKIFESTFFIILVSVTLYYKNVNLTMLSYSIAATVGFVLLYYLLRKQSIKLRARISKKDIKEVFAQAWPLALAGLFVIVYFRIDTIMLSYMKGDEVTGWYNAAYHFMYTFIFIPGFIMTSLFPKLSQFALNNKKKFKKLYVQSLLLITAVATVFMGTLWFAAEPIILQFYGAQYSPAVPVLKILTIAVFLSYVSHVWLFALTAIKKQHMYTWAVGAGMIINVILNIIFIPQYSLYAAAWTTVATEIITGSVIFGSCQYFILKLRK
ncbi:MAG: flippase [Patescibacteria group bacterium]